MKPSRMIVLFLGLFVGVIVGALAFRMYAAGGFDFDHESKAEEAGVVAAPSRVAIQNGEVVVMLDAEARSKGGVICGAAMPVFHQETLTGYGTVLSLQALTDINERYGALRATADKASANLESTNSEYIRLRILNADEKNISDKAVQAAETVRRSAEADARSAYQSLAGVESHLREQWGDTIARWVITSAPELSGLINQRELLIQITLPPGTATAPKSETALVESPRDTRTFLEARFISPARRTDPRIQGRSFFYRMSARSGDLLPEMNVAAHLPTGNDVAGFVVPDSAIVWLQGSPWIYVQKDSDHFVRREIRPESPLANGWFTRRGLTASDRIVVSGAQLLLSEEFRSQIRVGEE